MPASRLIWPIRCAIACRRATSARMSRSIWPSSVRSGSRRSCALSDMARTIPEPEPAGRKARLAPAGAQLGVEDVAAQRDALVAQRDAAPPEQLLDAALVLAAP